MFCHRVMATKNSPPVIADRWAIFGQVRLPQEIGKSLVKWMLKRESACCAVLFAVLLHPAVHTNTFCIGLLSVFTDSVHIHTQVGAVGLCHVTRAGVQDFSQRLRVRPADVAVCVDGQGAAPAGTVTDLGKVDGAFAGRIAFPGTAPAGQANLLSGVQVGEVAEQAHVLAPGAVIKAQAESSALFGALVPLQVGFHAFFVSSQNSIGIHSLCPLK